MAKKFKSNIWKIYIFNILASMMFVSPVLVPFFTDWGGLNFFQIMLLQSWFLFWFFILEIPTGTVADFLGRKHSLMLASLINVVGALVYGSTPNFFVFMIGEFLWGFSMSLYSGATEAFVYDSLKEINETEKSKKIMGRMESFKLVGIMLGAILGSLIVVIFDLRATMLFVSIPTGLAFFISLTFKEPPLEENAEKKSYLTILKEGVKYLHEHKILNILAIDMIFLACVAYFIIWLYQPMLKGAYVDIFYYGFVNVALLIIEIIIMNSYERLEKLFRSKKRLVFFTSSITGIGFIIGGLTIFVPLILLAIFLAGGFGLSRRPLLINYMNKYIPSEKRATVISTATMFEKLFCAIFNPFVGLLVDWSLSYTLIIIGIVAIVFSLISKVEESHLID
ncbi:MAG: MFS transporter [Promethearchaeota archaeon]